MKYPFDKIIDRRGTHSVKWDMCLTHFGSDKVLPFWVADMEFLSPPAVQEALQQRIRHNSFGYTLMPDSYWEAFATWARKRHLWKLERESLQFSPGVIPALDFAIQSMTKPGDGVIIQTPVYHPFYNVVKRNRRKLLLNPLRLENGRYYMDFENLEEHLKGGAKAVILCNPHNPVGRVYTKQELETLGEYCLRYGAKIISDEIHWDIVYSEALHVPIATLNKELADISITATSPGKTFNLQGFNTAFVVIPNKKLRNNFELAKHRNGIFMNNVLGIAATEAAYSEGEEWLDELLIYLEGNYKKMRDYIRKEMPGVEPIQPEGTYVAWLDFRKIPVDDIYRFMIDKAGVGMNNGLEFGEEGRGFLRFNFAAPWSMVEKGLEKMASALKML